MKSREKYIKKYSEERPYSKIILYSSDEKHFSDDFHDGDDMYISDLRDIDDWSKHTTFLEKKYWIDVTVMCEAYGLYLDETVYSIPIYSNFYFIQKIIDGDSSDINKYYKPLLRLKKMERLLE